MYLGLKLLPSQLAMMGLNEKDSIVSRFRFGYFSLFNWFSVNTYFSLGLRMVSSKCGWPMETPSVKSMLEQAPFAGDKFTQVKPLSGEHNSLSTEQRNSPFLLLATKTFFPGSG